MEKGLAVSMTQPMIQSAMESLDGMREFAKVILNSGIAPHHLYEKDQKGKPDFTKGNVEKLMGIFIKGDQLKMHPMTAMQEVVPVNGLLSIKGDGAKALILSSGKIEKKSWKESEEGSVEDGTFKVSITATRSDTGETLTRSFSVAQAKRAGLWITQEMLQKQDGYKKKLSAWYRYPERMIKYRALGFMARDLFSDVLSGTYTLEEAQDMPQDATTEIATTGGATLVIPDKQFTEDRSKRITGNAAAMIDEFNDTPPAGETPPVGSELPSAQDIVLPDAFHWTEEELSKAKAKDLEDACNQVGITKDAVQIIPGKNTNKKLRIIILAHMAGKLPSIMDNYRSGEPYTKPETVKQETSPVESSMPHGGPVLGQEPKVAHQETPPTVKKDPDDFMEPAEGTDQGGEIEPNLEFEGKGEYVQSSTKESGADEPTQPDNEASILVDTNKHGIEIPELSENGDRPFEQLSQLFMGMQEAGLNNQQFDEANAKMLKGKYKNMEEFCKIAPASEINILLNSIG